MIRMGEDPSESMWAGRPIGAWVVGGVLVIAFNAAWTHDALWALLVAVLVVAAANTVVVRVRDRRRAEIGS